MPSDKGVVDSHPSGGHAYTLAREMAEKFGLSVIFLIFTPEKSKP